MGKDNKTIKESRFDDEESELNMPDDTIGNAHNELGVQGEYEDEDESSCPGCAADLTAPGTIHSGPNGHTCAECGEDVSHIQGIVPDEHDELTSDEPIADISDFDEAAKESDSYFKKSMSIYMEGLDGNISTRTFKKEVLAEKKK